MKKSSTSHKTTFSKDEIIKLFVRYNHVKKVAEKTGVSQYYIRELLIKEFGLSITELKKVLRLSPYNEIRLPHDKVEQMKRVKKIYDRWGTLKDTARELGFTGEHVRQILKDASRYNVVDYVSAQKRNKEKVAQLKRFFSRDRIIKELIVSPKYSLVSARLKIPEDDLIRLIRLYKIKKDDYSLEHKRQKWIKRYRQIVLVLGHYPTVTELKSYGKWASVYNALCRYWGSFENFRKEMNIPSYNKRSKVKRRFKKTLHK